MHTTKLIHEVRWSLALILALGVWLLLQPLAVRAETIPVTSTLDSGAGTLRQAIADAAPGDTIIFDDSLSGLTITLTSTLSIPRNLTIDGSGLTVPVTLDGNNAVRIFKVTNNAHFTLVDVSLTRGRDPSTECDSQTYYAPEWVSCGGGIKIEPGSVMTATGITVQQSHAYMGGGIYNAGTLLIRNSTLSNNTSGEGGGIHNTRYSGGIGALTVQTCTISGNTADAAGLAGINAGLNTGGGGIYDYYGSVTVQDSTLSGNTTSSPSSGGGLHTLWGAVLVQNSTLSGNVAQGAGGIYNYHATVTLQNSTLISNTSSWESGGIHAFYGTLHYQNTLIANNTGGDCGYSFEGPIGTNINNWVKDGSCSAAFSGDPLVSPLANNGGETLTHALLPGSPAIDAGDPASCPDTDQRGVTRPQVGSCDIGAFESQGFTLTYADGSDQSTLVNTTFGIPLAVTVSSSAGEPVDGGQVIFTSPASGAALSSSPLTVTISGGEANWAVTANGIGGSYVVTATTQGSLATISYSLTNNTATEIAVIGNTQVIDDGAASPSTADHTDFGSVTLGQTLTRTFTISNDGSATLALTGTPAVSLSGADAFSVVAQPATSVEPSASITFQVRFTPSVAGTQSATVTIANNDSNEAPYDFVIQGTGANQAPGADAGSDQSANVRTVVTLDGSASSDPDGHTPLSYGWTQTGGPAVTLSSAAAVSPTFTAPGTPTVLTFTLRVTDAYGLAASVTDEVVITVNDVSAIVYLPLVQNAHTTASSLEVAHLPTTAPAGKGRDRNQ